MQGCRVLSTNVRTVSFLFGKPVQRENVPTGICENVVAFFYRTASMVSMNLFGVLMDIEATVTTVVAVGCLSVAWLFRLCAAWQTAGKAA